MKQLLTVILATITAISAAVPTTTPKNYFEDFSKYQDGQSLFEVPGWSGTTDNFAGIRDWGGYKVAGFRGTNFVNSPNINWNPGKTGQVMTIEWDMSISPDISGGAAVGLYDISASGKTEFIADAGIFETSRILGGDRETGFHYALVADSKSGWVRGYLNGICTYKSYTVPGSQWHLDHLVFRTDNMSDDGYVTMTNIKATFSNSNLVLSVPNNYIKEGDKVECEATLPTPAPQGGEFIKLATSNKVASVFIPEGQTSATFILQANAASQNTPFTVYAASPDSSATAPSTVRSLTLQKLALAKYGVKGGQSTTGSFSLESAALQGGKTIQLSSSDSSVSVPASVTVAAGTQAGGFTVNTSGVKAKKTVKITVTCGDRKSQLTLTVNP